MHTAAEAMSRHTNSKAPSLPPDQQKQILTAKEVPPGSGQGSI